MNHDLEQGDRLMFLFQASNLRWNGSGKVVKVVSTIVPLLAQKQRHQITVEVLLMWLSHFH